MTPKMVSVILLIVLSAVTCMALRPFLTVQGAPDKDPDLSEFTGDARYYRVPADRPNADHIPLFNLGDYPLIYHDDARTIKVYRASDKKLLYQRRTIEVYPEIEQWKQEAGL